MFKAFLRHNEFHVRLNQLGHFHLWQFITIPQEKLISLALLWPNKSVPHCVPIPHAFSSIPPLFYILRNRNIRNKTPSAEHKLLHQTQKLRVTQRSYFFGQCFIMPRDVVYIIHETWNFILKANTLCKYWNEEEIKESKVTHYTLDEEILGKTNTKGKLITVYVLSRFRFTLPFSWLTDPKECGNGPPCLLHIDVPGTLQLCCASFEDGNFS